MKPLPILLTALLLAAPAGVIAKDHGREGCPPGLAKKSPPCVPPGLAKKGYSSDGWRDGREHDAAEGYLFDHYRRGDRLPRDRYVALRTGDHVIFNGERYTVVDTRNGIILRRGDYRYRVPRYNDGTDLVRVGDVLVRVDGTTGAIVQMIRLADLILR